MTNAYQPVSGLRRLGAILYDSLLLLAVLFFAAFLVQPWIDGQASHLFRLYLFSVSYFYFAWPWLRSGQTLGMATWQIRLQANDSQPITWKQTFLRFTVALISWLAFGMGFIWIWFNPQRRTWHDWASGTHLVYCSSTKQSVEDSHS